MKLSQLTIGANAIIQSVDLQEPLKYRFMEIGLRVGTVVQICSKTLTSDNLYLKLDNSSCISINKDEAAHIKILPIDQRDQWAHYGKISDSQDCVYPNCIIKNKTRGSV